MRGVSGRKSSIDNSEFYRRTNFLALMLLLFIVVVLISSSRVLDRFAEKEIERAQLTGRLSSAGTQGNVSLTIIDAPVTSSDTTADNETAAVQRVLTSGGKIGFGVNKFEIDILRNMFIEREFTIKNNFDGIVEFSFGTSLKDYVTIEPNRVTLNPGETGTLKAVFYGYDVGIVTGYISVTGGNLKDYMPVILNIVSSSDLGVVKVSIPEKYFSLDHSQDITLSVELSGFDNDVVEFVYLVKDALNNEILRISQYLNVKDSMKFDKVINLPKNLPDGLYVVGVELRYLGATLADSEVFTIGSRGPFLEEPGILEKKFGISDMTFRVVIALIILLLVLSLITYSFEMKKINKFAKK